MLAERLATSKKTFEEVFLGYPKKEKCILDLISREEFKGEVNLLDEQHQRQSSRIVQWCSEYHDIIGALGTKIENVATVHSQIASLEACNQAIEHEMNHKVSCLRKLEDRILNSSYESSEYPSHRWKHENDEASMKSLSDRYEHVVVAMASLSEQCNKKHIELQRCLSDQQDKEEIRLQFSAMVDEFTQWMEQTTDSVKESHFGFNVTEMENYQ